jgi:hypothetical protein
VRYNSPSSAEAEYQCKYASCATSSASACVASIEDREVDLPLLSLHHAAPGVCRCIMPGARSVALPPHQPACVRRRPRNVMEIQPSMVSTTWKLLLATRPLLQLRPQFSIQHRIRYFRGIRCASPLHPAADSDPSRRRAHNLSEPSISTAYSRAYPPFIGAMPAPFRVTSLPDPTEPLWVTF